jgi:hypothetical protein
MPTSGTIRPGYVFDDFLFYHFVFCVCISTICPLDALLLLLTPGLPVPASSGNPSIFIIFRQWARMGSLDAVGLENKRRIKF